MLISTPHLHSDNQGKDLTLQKKLVEFFFNCNQHLIKLFTHDQEISLGVGETVPRSMYCSCWRLGHCLWCSKGLLDL